MNPFTKPLLIPQRVPWTWLEILTAAAAVVWVGYLIYLAVS